MGRYFLKIIKEKRSSIFKIILLALIALWIPTILIYFLGEKNDKKVYNVKNSGKTIIMENEKLDIEEFIPCVVASQIDIKSNEEVIKAFTVVIRTYINRQMKNSASIEADKLGLPYITYSQMEKVWENDFTKNYNMLMKSVSNTAMEMLYYNDELIVPYYHYLSSGKTRTGSEVGENCNLPYLKSVTSKGDITNEKFLSMKTMSYEEFANTIMKFRDSIVISKENPLEVVSIVERDSAGYVKNIQVGTTLLTGDEFMKCFALNSPDFTVENYEEKVRIITKGNGHGLGLSIVGANNMAGEGASYKEILLYYYTDIKIK